MVRPIGATRSMLFAGATRPDLVAKLGRSGADAVVVDLEDAVPVAAKDEARGELSKLVGSVCGPLVFVRVNGPETGWFDEDVAAVAPLSVAGIVIPKTESTADLERARALLGEANSALHRLRLFQLAALPETTPGSEASKPSQVLVEIPVRLGQELCMAQFQVGRDGANGGNEQEARRGWQMRFSVNFSAIGEVGAQIGLLGHRVNISIWAERSATAEALQSMLPEVTQALAAKGIETVSLQCRHGIPKAPNPPPAGLYVDAVR